MQPLFSKDLPHRVQVPPRYFGGGSPPGNPPKAEEIGENPRRNDDETQLATNAHGFTPMDKKKNH
jgi:hypothetical protein